jgi:predicted neutral ceramidase superfamily lipid hydrolase
VDIPAHDERSENINCKQLFVGSAKGIHFDKNPRYKRRLIMKALIVLAILATLALIFFLYSQNRDLKKLLIALATFGAIISLAVVGNLTRQVFPLFLAHVVLIILSWGGLLVYLVRDKYYWWIIFSPVVTIGLFLLLELLTGSGHEILG